MVAENVEFRQQTGEILLSEYKNALYTWRNLYTTTEGVRYQYLEAIIGNQRIVNVLGSVLDQLGFRDEKKLVDVEEEARFNEMYPDRMLPDSEYLSWRSTEAGLLHRAHLEQATKVRP